MNNERNLLAISIKHTEHRWKFGKPCVLWGSRTQDGEKRSFGGYTIFPKKAELYSLSEWQNSGYGTRNACSMLYAAAWRAARAMGYHKLITYILDNEPGTSLRAAGWKCVGQAGGLRWTGKRRPEVDLCPAQMKLRWEIGDEAALEEKECME